MIGYYTSVALCALTVWQSEVLQVTLALLIEHLAELCPSLLLLVANRSTRCEEVHVHGEKGLKTFKFGEPLRKCVVLWKN